MRKVKLGNLEAALEVCFTKEGKIGEMVSVCSQAGLAIWNTICCEALIIWFDRVSLHLDHQHLVWTGQRRDIWNLKNIWVYDRGFPKSWKCISDSLCWWNRLLAGFCLPHNGKGLLAVSCKRGMTNGIANHCCLTYQNWKLWIFNIHILMYT